MEPERPFNPFPGLRPFEPEEDHLFFGREKQIDELLRRLRTTRFLPVIGSSGSGKSSLVRCGLIPSLHGGVVTDAGSSWRVSIMRPGEDPVGHLAAALDAPHALGNAGEVAETQANRVIIEATLRRSARGLIEAVRQARIPPEDNVLVVVDQFEELFRFRASRTVEDARDEAIAFVRLLLSATQQRTVPIFVVLTLRSDFIGDCMAYPGLPEAVNAGLYLVPRMTRDELRAAITGPVAVGHGAIAPRLVLRLLNDVGDDPDQLPVLQHALMRTWEKWEAHGDPAAPLDIAEYEATGTMQDALSRHAEEAYADAGSDARKQIVERVFKALTDTTTDERGVRRPTSVGELAAICQTSVFDIASIVELFRRPGRTFLMPPPAIALGPDSIIDISHESLMRGWTRLIGWTEEERVSAEHYIRLSQAAARHEQGTAGLWRDPELELGLKWRQENEPTEAWAERYDPSFDRAMAFLEDSRRERDRESAAREAARKTRLRRAWQVAASLAALLLVAVGLAGYARSQQRFAERQRARADENLALAKRAVDESMTSISGDFARAVAADVPQLEDFRRELLEKAQEFYARFSELEPESDELRLEIAAAHVKLGDIYRLLQRAEVAEQEYRTGIGQLQGLMAAHPERVDYREALGNAYNWLGELLRPLDGRDAAADEAYGAALELQQALSTEHPDEDAYRQELARTHYNRGILRSSAGHSDGSDYREAIRLLEPLAQDGLLSARQELARTFNNLGLLLVGENRRDEARGYYEQAIEIHEQLAGAEPQDREIEFELAKFYNNLGILLQEENALDLARRRNDQALRAFEDLARSAPSLDMELAHGHHLRGRILQGLGENAEQEYATAVRIFRGLKDLPEVRELPEFRLKFGDALYDLASWRWSAGELRRALEPLGDALEQHAAAPDGSARLAYDYALLVQVQLDLGRTREASDALERLAEVVPRVPEASRSDLVAYYEMLRSRL